jgi:hypothetical protein
MLLLHQIGSVKIGEVVRYTVTYTPSHDRILPSPEFLYLRVRNTCAIALRAAFVHGPYTLSASAYPSTYNPNEKFAHPRRYGVPEFEPMLKAAGTWSCHLVVPDNIRQNAGTGGNGQYFGTDPHGHETESVSWIIEVTSQVIFSTSAAVNYEILVARDEKSLNLSSGVPVVGNQAQVPQPGRVSDYQQTLAAKDRAFAQRGVFSKAIRLKVEDTAGLWNTPRLPGWDEAGWSGRKSPTMDMPVASQAKIEDMNRSSTPKPKKVHLVVLTHGLHSNLSADMLFLKESIDAGVKQAKLDAKKRRARERAERSAASSETDSVDTEDDEDDEEVIVRGFSGNATRTERGIKYLGKRFARFILSMTYPDQPFLPVAKAASDVVAHAVKVGSHKHDDDGKPAHRHSTILKAPSKPTRNYKFTKISFIGHSLGGLIQMYAVAYIQKHSPQFFDIIEPVNFIALASPFLGLNHENPLYVKFALDFGLVGRTGQDLGLTWRAPTIARSGWGAIVSNLGENAHKRVYGESQPESKPLLRILPTGPAHIALKKFRNRTVYSNVVNDGIVPLRTSCLLFLDWQGLGRVEKARREAGLVETVVRSGWAELTGANVTSPRIGPWSPVEERDDGSTNSKSDAQDSHLVPQPSTNATLEDDRRSLRSSTIPYHEPEATPSPTIEFSSTTINPSPFSGFFNFFRSNEPPKSPTISQKQSKIYQRSQTLFSEHSVTDSAASSRSRVTSGQELSEDSDGVSAPPKTTFFESAGDLLNPKLPSLEFLLDPSKRPRTIFHDRVYHPSDIPPPPLKRRSVTTLSMRRKTQTQTGSTTSTTKTGDSGGTSPFPSPQLPHEDSSLSKRDYDDTMHTNPNMDPDDVIDSSQMKVEEKIARAYHRGLSWRKVLVKLEPDAHNNIIVRRTFANAFGWPVVHHLVEAHFSDSEAARTRDDEEAGGERAKHPTEPPDENGAETKKIADPPARGRQPSAGTPAPPPQPALELIKKEAEEQRSESEAREALDSVPELPTPSTERRPSLTSSSSHASLSPDHPSPGTSRPQYDRLDSVAWSDRDWADSADESEDGDHSTHHQRVELGSPLAKHDKRASAQDDGGARPSSGAWDWTEKIVGKGMAAGGSKPGGSASGKGPFADDD